MSALSFELTGRNHTHVDYSLFLGTATAALYAAHWLIGIRKKQKGFNTERFEWIIQYKALIGITFCIWCLLSILLLWNLNSFHLVLWLIPGGIVGLAYILPWLPAGRRLRDTGWWKIILVSFSWSWLTAFIPFLIFSEASLFLSFLHGLERFFFIFLLAMAFEIRDIEVDQSHGLTTLPVHLGKKKSFNLAILFGLFIPVLSLFPGFHYFNTAYILTMTLMSIIAYFMIRVSYNIRHDMFFTGWVDGCMILALLIYLFVNVFI